MSITIAGYSFAGPYKSTAELEDRSGVYTILTPSDATHFNVLDVGESATVKTRVEGHDRKPYWLRNAIRGQIVYAVYYTPHLQQAGRKAVEIKIRQQYNPPCGSR